MFAGHAVVSCSWCHRANPIDDASALAKTWCQNCGHRADVARVDCDCADCVVLRATARRLQMEGDRS